MLAGLTAHLSIRHSLVVNMDTPKTACRPTLNHNSDTLVAGLVTDLLCKTVECSL